MAALTADIIPLRRGAEPTRNTFGYPIAPGEKVFRGSIVGINAAGQIQRAQTAGTVILLGLSNLNYDNTGSAVPGPIIVPMKGTWGLVVPAATPSNIQQAVYATDDATCTLASTTGSLANLALGTLAGLDNGLTFVSIQGS